jgi:hypothetical protein
MFAGRGIEIHRFGPVRSRSLRSLGLSRGVQTVFADTVEILAAHLGYPVLFLVVPPLRVAFGPVVAVLALTGVLRVPETASNPSGGIF